MAHTITDHERKLIQEGLLTEREATQLGLWAKRKLIDLRREVKALKLELDAARDDNKQRVGEHGIDEPTLYSIADGINRDAVPVGDRFSSIQVRANDGQRYPTFEIRALNFRRPSDEPLDFELSTRYGSLVVIPTAANRAIIRTTQEAL